MRYQVTDILILEQKRRCREGKVSELTAGGGRLLTAGEVQETVRTRIEETGASIVQNNGLLRMRFDDLDGANQAIDLLRESGARIESLERSRSTLEDVFIRTVEESQP